MALTQADDVPKCAFSAGVGGWGLGVGDYNASLPYDQAQTPWLIFTEVSVEVTVHIARNRTQMATDRRGQMDLYLRSSASYLRKV
jgi:hypothetical protein